jgi:hypothetical protein
MRFKRGTPTFGGTGGGKKGSPKLTGVGGPDDEHVETEDGPRESLDMLGGEGSACLEASAFLEKRFRTENRRVENVRVEGVGEDERAKFSLYSL